jgi:hypothetical protein
MSSLTADGLSTSGELTTSGGLTVTGTTTGTTTTTTTTDTTGTTTAQPDLSNLLTIVVTSSPAKCNPHLNMLDIVVQSFSIVPGLSKCHTIVMCDGYKRGKKHRPSRGIIDEKSAKAYEKFLENVRIASNTVGNTLHDVQVVVQPERLGFGFAVKRAVEEFVTTPYVMVVHHDQRYRRTFDLPSIVSEMMENTQINYVGVLSPGTLGYENKCQSKELPNPTNGVLTCKSSGRMVPLYVWFDRNHVASTSFYKENVFTSGLVRKGTFIEDCYGQQMLKDIKENGLDAHKKYGCYFYDDGIDESMIHHIDGRRWMTPEQRKERGLPEQKDIMK